MPRCIQLAREAARIFSDRFPDRPSPDHKTVLRVLARAQETGKVLPNRNEIGGGARTAWTLPNEEAILNIAEEDGTRSIREIAQEVDISSRSVHRVLNENRLHPFHYTRVQHLEPEDYPARRNFCVWLLNKAAEVFHGSCFPTNQVLVGRDVSTIEICMSGRRVTYPRAF
jgi:hypothetical protein